MAILRYAGRAEDFNRVAKAFAEQARVSVDEVIRQSASEIVTRLAARTHVQTGRLVGNWRASLNVQDFFFDERKFDPGRTNAVAENLRIIANAQMGDRVFIQNNTPYLVHEEFGTAKRAGHPVVRQVAADIPNIVREVVARVRSQQPRQGLFARARAFFTGR